MSVQPIVVKKHKNSFSDEKLERAKKYPIEDLYPGKLKIVGKAKMGLCCFHKENTPSLAIYPSTNSWHCFAGCGGGDVISFYMKLKKVDFKTALEELTK